MRELFIRFNLSRHTPKRCTCPYLADGQDPQTAGMEWLAKDCKCCLHMQWAEGWPAERCQPCIRSRFPLRTYAEWELMCRVVKRGMFGVLSPMGGSMQTEYHVDEHAFEFWAGRIARIRSTRWAKLLDVVEWMHGQVEQLAEGKFPFTDDEYADLIDHGDGSDQSQN